MLGTDQKCVSLSLSMACISDFFAQQHDIWEGMSFTSCEDVSVSEVWNYATDKIPHSTREDFSVKRSGLQSWLATSSERTKGRQDVKGSRSLRIVWIPRVVQRKVLDVHEDTFRDIHANFNHEVAYRSSLTSVAALGRVTGAPPGSPVYFLSLHPKVSMTWSFNEQSELVSVICITEVSKIKILKEVLGQTFIQNIANQPMAPALMHAVLLSMEIDQCHQQIKTQVRQVEVRTGHHDWKSRTEPPALGDLTELSAKMSGYQIRTGSCVRKQYALVELLNFVRRQQRSLRPDSYKMDLEDPDSISAMVTTLEEKARAQQTDVGYIECRIKTQLDAVSLLTGFCYSRNIAITFCTLTTRISSSYITSLRSETLSSIKKWPKTANILRSQLSAILPV